MSHSIHKMVFSGRQWERMAFFRCKIIFLFFEIFFKIFQNFQFIKFNFWRNFSIFLKIFNNNTFLMSRRKRLFAWIHNNSSIFQKKSFKALSFEPGTIRSQQLFVWLFSSNFELKHIAFNHFSKICVLKKHFSVT